MIRLSLLCPMPTNLVDHVAGVFFVLEGQINNLNSGIPRVFGF
jgi:hypothetical protein